MHRAVWYLHRSAAQTCCCQSRWVTRSGARDESRFHATFPDARSLVPTTFLRIPFWPILNNSTSFDRGTISTLLPQHVETAPRRETRLHCQSFQRRQRQRYFIASTARYVHTAPSLSTGHGRPSPDAVNGCWERRPQVHTTGDARTISSTSSSSSSYVEPSAAECGSAASSAQSRTA